MAEGDRFVTEWDGTPSFWNYLLGLDRADLVAELVQNDLDQDATRTVVSFEENRLVCEGDGKPVEADGWQRLRKMQGAGDKVRAKRGKIGVKNHGLKTAFTVGDELELSSAGQRVVQTLYANGRDKPPYPGASPEPRADPQAPVEGCRTTIWYRTADLEPREGEAGVLGAISGHEMDDLFVSACASAPEQFAGIVVPEVAPRYEIMLRHWRLGEVRFVFSCTRPRKIAKRIELFRRRCTVSGTAHQLPLGLYEQAARRLVPPQSRLSERAADFFRRGRNFFVEVSWPIDRRGKPTIGTGRFRYPIGYPRDSVEARTGHSAYFNAPITSDNARRGPAKNEATNIKLRRACESLLTDTIACYSVPQWGPQGLNPLVADTGAKDAYKTIRPLLASLVKQGAIPVLSWRKATDLLFKGKRRKIVTAARRIGPRSASSKRAQRYRFVVPVLTWAEHAIHPSLSLLAPRSEKQLDPRVHPDILRLLTDGETDGFLHDFVTFDENAAFHRITGAGNDYFGAISDRQRVLAEPSVAHAHLDLIELAICQGKLKSTAQDELLIALMVPDDRARATPLRNLSSSAPVPSDIPGLRIPPVLHADLVGHPLFRRTKWRRPKYGMAQFLDGDTLRSADEKTRRQFWKWLRENQLRVRPRDRPKLADLAIWPDENGALCRISDLCDPRSRRVGAALDESIRRPHKQVRGSRLVSGAGRSRASVRRVPTAEEIAGWLKTRMAPFRLGETADARTSEALHALEADLAVLLKDSAIARLLATVQVSLPALARDGSIQHRAALVMPSPRSDLLALPARFLLNGSRRTTVLDTLSSTLRDPTAAMLLETFLEDSCNFSALHARLQHFLKTTEPDDDCRRQLADTAILPVDGQPRRPSELAFSSNRGYYWGTWKTRISTRGLSQDDQHRYRLVGVTPSSPNEKTSRAFFEWLAIQRKDVLRHHIPDVLRHILHRDGPSQWARVFPHTPFIPARGYDGLRLISLALGRTQSVFLPDVPEIVDTVLDRDHNVLLVIDCDADVGEPISQSLRDLGIKSLRVVLKEPVSVAGRGNVVPADADVIAGVHTLQSRRFQRTFRKRLSVLGVELDLVRNDWHDRLQRIKDVRFADRVEACYRFRRRVYPRDVDAGFDPNSSILWVKKEPSTGVQGLYTIIAAQLIFKTSASPIHLLALEHTVNLRLNDQRHSYRAVEIEPEDDSIPMAGTGPDEPDNRADGVLAEAEFGHSPFEPDPARNVPRPRPISSTSAQSPRQRTHRNPKESQGGVAQDPIPRPRLEREHIEALKRDHYSSHCQMCLCERPPHELAPADSYIEWEEVRRGVIDAHHVDLKSAGGGRHAGNLMLLCKRHHHNFGRRLTRDAITDALRTNAEVKSVSFGPDSEVTGRRIEVVIPDTREAVGFFFTDEHAHYWLSDT